MSWVVARSELVVSASRQRIWEVLTDFPAYPDWNPLLREVHGEAERGRSLNVRLAGFGHRGRNLWPDVRSANRGRELCLALTILPAGLLDANWRVVLIREEGGQCRIAQRIRCSGWLSRWYAPRLARTLTPALAAMNEALRRRAEADQPIRQRRA
ncbi:SRPBCC family protein [Niveibacterium terrae]|uniref:SRPBCC family protein n=1 Tax=Niveibacterium terrae TaxID=3373598 RepID=UPI003A903302